MKSGIHPEYEVAQITCACGRVTETRSTVGEIHVEICSHCHPFFTGRQKLVDTAGRVERFFAKYGTGDTASSGETGTAGEAAEAASGTAPEEEASGDEPPSGASADEVDATDDETRAPVAEAEPVSEESPPATGAEDEPEEKDAAQES